MITMPRQGKTPMGVVRQGLMLWATLAVTSLAAWAQDRGTWEITDKDGNVTEREPITMATVDVGLPQHIEVGTESSDLGEGIPIELTPHRVTLETYRDPAPFSAGGVKEFVEDASGKLWIRTVQGVLAYQDDSDWVVVRNAVDTEKVGRIAAHPDGSLWVSGTKRFARIEGGAIQAYEVPVPTMQGISHLACGPQGDVWLLVGTSRHYPTASLMLWHYDGSSWRQYEEEDGVPLGRVTGPVIDHNGTAWFATQYELSLPQVGGDPQVYSLAHGSWAVHDLPIAGNGYALLQHVDRLGRLWVSSIGQTFVKDDTGWSEYRSSPWSGILSLIIDGHDRAWISGGNQFGILQGSKWTGAKYDTLKAVLGAYPSSLHRLPSGDVVLGTTLSSSPSLILWRNAERATTAVGAPSAAPPQDFKLQGNYPNPFNASTQISYWVPSATSVRLQILSVSGQVVKTLQRGAVGPGRYTVTWDGRTADGQPAATGVYLYCMSMLTGTYAGKMALLR